MAVRLRSALSRGRQRRPPPRCSTRRASGATWSRSRGTSRPSRGRTRSAAMLDAHARAHRSRATGTRPSRRTPPTGSRRRGSRSRPRSGRGNGLLRLRDGKAWTLLTALVRAQGPRGAEGHAPAEGRRARRRPRPRDVARGSAMQEAETLGYSEQPEVVIVGGGQGAIGLGARLRQLGVPTIICRAQRAPRRLVAQALQVAVPARPGLVRPPAVHQVPRELAGVLAQGQDRRLARDVHAGHGAQLLGLDRRSSRRRTTTTRATGSCRSSATARRSRCARSSSCWPPA